MLLSFALSFVSILILLFNNAFADEIVKKIEIEGLNSISNKEFIYLLGVEEGKVLNKEEINRGIKRLFLKGIFDDIVVNYDNGVLKIEVKEKLKIKRINIEGNEYFSEKFYINSLNLKTGDFFSKVKLQRAIANIQNEMNKRGFPENKISYVVSQEGQDVSMRILVEEGNPLRVKNIIWQGSLNENIKNLLSINQNDPFDKVMIEEFIKKSMEYLEKKGFKGSSIKYSFEKGELKIFIDEGVKLEIEIKGADSLTSKELKDLIMAHFKDKVSEDIIKDSVNNLITFYRTKGFIDVKISPLMEKKGNEWNITYIINEGEKRIVDKILFMGNFKTPPEELKKILINREGIDFNPEELENDRLRIEDFLRTKGYYEAKVSQPDIKDRENKIEISFNIEEGKLLKIISINIEVKENFLKKEAIDAVASFINFPFSNSVFIEIKRRIREVYIKKGYQETLVEGVTEKTNEGILIKITVHPGNKKYFGRSIILGNKKTKTNFIYDRLTHKENVTFNPEYIDKDRQNLYKTGLFSRVDINYEKYDDTIDLIYNVEELPAGIFEFGLGYGEYERAKGFVELSYINLFGVNKQLFSRLEISSIEKRSYITYIDPWLWSDLIFKSSLLFERTDMKNIDTKYIIYRIRKYGLSGGFEKKFFDYFKGELLYEATYSKIWDVRPEVILSDKDIGEIFISGIKASLIYDTRDNVFDPTRGWLAGVTSKISSEALGSEINFSKTSFYINRYTELKKGLVLATSLRAGFAWLYGNSKELPISERYFLGGRDTVRGYAQNTLGPKKDNEPTGGNAFLMGNLELRTSLGKNFYLINFLDFGNLWQKIDNMSITNLKYTTGLGLRYKTPVGPFRIDYGYKLNREKGESRGEIHFSIGHAF
ncbi:MULTISPECIES: outer membrane protein assembly factor BamA [Thermodesulfovibrio]|uniref:outer membrane protein assembly factor BamA n=1 Tax=Thermodesulfovibrio TaxID=28261 RepID=UPI002618B302|nr:outer membrane protein assembly factor BamA [Thermodesulfovibrio sp.]